MSAKVASLVAFKLSNKSLYASYKLAADSTTYCPVVPN